MRAQRPISTGRPGLDRILDGLRLGDTVVWQVDSNADYRAVCRSFANRSLADNRKVVYIHWQGNEPLLDDDPGIVVRELDPSVGFEAFGPLVHELIMNEGLFTHFVFDCLTDLLHFWHSDMSVMSFFKVVYPFLFELDTVSYFSIRRGEHLPTGIAGIRETAHVLLDLHRLDGATYVHPLKVWGRHAPTMFYPHMIQGNEATPVTSSEVVARLYAAMEAGSNALDYWERTLERARRAMAEPGHEMEQESLRQLLLRVHVGTEGRVVELCRQYLSLADLVDVSSKQVGAGPVGGKTVGMLLARAILKSDPENRFADRLEPHDSLYLGTPLFYSYVVANGWWSIWAEHKTPEGYESAGETLRPLLETGWFPPGIRQRFLWILQHFGESPIIVRSSSLLEDNYGNAFAGKYESVFCVNQGPIEERLRAFEDAIRTVYASAMSEDALAYRLERGLGDREEQMAILVQRVSGSRHGDEFFPHAAGVGNSSNIYVWDPKLDPEAGMLRLVFGLGTRAVDRISSDYPRLVALDDPNSRRLNQDVARYSQHRVDSLSYPLNCQHSQPLNAVRREDISADWSLFVSPDWETIRRMDERGRRLPVTPEVLDFAGLMSKTDFPEFMRNMLRRLADTYEYPVDIEFTVNMTSETDYQVNLVQCRPLQTRGLGRAVRMPADTTGSLFSARGNFMGGNARLPVNYAVTVRPEAYLALGDRQKHEVASVVGKAMRALDGEQVMLLGPGRWGSTTAALGVPVKFADISGVTALVEFTYARGGFRPELSYGSHFFQELVERGIFYVALMDHDPELEFHPGVIVDRPNLLEELVPDEAEYTNCVHVAAFESLVLYSDIQTQRIICC